ncbi:unnamed protein product, partial [Prorocentrum cordatum]
CKRPLDQSRCEGMGQHPEGQPRGLPEIRERARGRVQEQPVPQPHARCGRGA